MDILDRYILAVKQALPEDKRVEIGRELKANLQDEIDALIEESSNRVDYEQAATQTLQKYGHPQLTAQRFYTDPPLVSGANMSLYKRVLTHSAAALFVYALLKTIVNMLQVDSINPFRLIIQSAATFIGSFAWLFLALTIAFYLLSKSFDLSNWQYKNWKLDSLPKGPLLRIKTSDTITDLITNSFLLLVLWTPLWMNESVYEQQVLSLAPSAEYWRIIITLLCAQSLVQALYRFSKSHWDKLTSVAYLFDLLLFGFAALFLALTEPLLLVNAELEVNGNAIARILESISQSVQYALITISFVLFVLAFFQYKKYRLLK